MRPCGSESTARRRGTPRRSRRRGGSCAGGARCALRLAVPPRAPRGPSSGCRLWACTTVGAELARRRARPPRARRRRRAAPRRRACGRPAPSRASAPGGSPRPRAAPPAAAPPRAPRRRDAVAVVQHEHARLADRNPSSGSTRSASTSATALSRNGRSNSVAALAYSSRERRSSPARSERASSLGLESRATSSCASSRASGSASYAPGEGTVTSAQPADSASSCDSPWSSQRDAFTNTRARATRCSHWSRGRGPIHSTPAALACRAAPASPARGRAPRHR